MAEWWKVPPLWLGESCIVMASGPSLTSSIAEYAGTRCKVIAISDTWRLWPSAEILYSCDGKWWRHHKNVPEYKGLKVTLDDSLPYSDIKCLKMDLDSDGRPIDTGLALEPDKLRTGMNSGYQAINLAVHLGVKRILLLGFDMRVVDGRSHYFGDHPAVIAPKKPSPYNIFIEKFKTMVEPLRKLGVEVINCTPASALPWFPMAKLEDVL